MNMDLRLNGLFGLYGNLLTEHQKDLFNLYYECDLSLGEIAEIKGISRQSVNDGLKKAREILSDSEKLLGFAGKFSEIEKILASCKDGSLTAEEGIAEIRNLLEEEN